MALRDQGPLTRSLVIRPLMTFAVAFGLGAVLARRGEMPLVPLLAIAGGFLLATILLARLGKRRVAALLMAAGLFLGAARMTVALVSRPEVETRYSVAISGVIQGEPLYQEEEGRLVCRLTGVNVEDAPLNADIRLYLRGDSAALRNARAGQRVEAMGMLWAAKPAQNPGEFDFSAFLWKNGMAAYATAKASDAVISGSPSGFSAWLNGIRSKISARVEALFPRNAAIVEALILGNRDDLSDELAQDFSRAGIAHLLAISGLHVTLIALIAAWLFRLFLPRRWSFFLTLALVVAYGLLSGMRASVLRAILMFAIAGFGSVRGRPSDAPTRLAAAFLLLLTANPLYLMDAGFVLSFSASAGLIFLSPAMGRLFGLPAISQRRFGGRLFHGALSLASATMCAQLATLPAMIETFRELPLLSLVTNLLAVPLAMLALLLAMLALFVPFLAAPLSWLADFLFDGLALLSGLGAKLPFNALRFAPFPALLSAAFAALIFACSELCKLSKRAREWLLLALPLTACLAAVFCRLDTAGLSIAFLSAGNADAAVISAQGQTYLVDAGLAQTPADEYLLARNLRPTAIFLSHPDDDHAGGLLEILESVPPECVYVPAGWFDVLEEGEVSQAMARAREMGIPIVELASGDRLRLSEDVFATVLHPEAGADISDANGLSMLLLVEYGEGAALFTGDLSIAREPESLPDVDVLKVAHHGSNSSTSYRLIAETSPTVAVVSTGENSYGHPSEAVVERLREFGTEVWRTDRAGAVTVRIFRDGGVRVTSFYTNSSD